VVFATRSSKSTPKNPTFPPFLRPRVSLPRRGRGWFCSVPIRSAFLDIYLFIYLASPNRADR
jgi:hypothetical protein